MGPRQLRAFLAAPSNVDVEAVRQVLSAEGVLVEDSYSSGAGADLITATIRRIRQSDFVIAIITESGWAAYEVGIADAFAKPVLIIVSPDLSVPSYVASRQVLRTKLISSDVLRLTLRNLAQQVRQDPKQLRPKSKRANKRQSPAAIERLRGAIQHARADAAPREIETLALDLLKASGATVVAQPAEVADRGVDFAVWADRLAAVIGGPLLVEVKAGRLTTDSIHAAEALLARGMSGETGRFALLLYLDREGRRFSAATWETPFVLRFDLEDFAQSLTSQSLADLVIHQRNRLVHKKG